MKIDSIQTYLVRIGSRNMPYIRVLTDEGIHGVGEAYSIGPDLAVIKVIEDFSEWLVGENPLDIERLWQLMYAGSRFPGGSILNAAISGIEHALWDIKGKVLGVPVYELVGGKCRDKVRVYQGVGGRSPAEVAENASKLVEKYSYTALKMSPFDSGSPPHDLSMMTMLKAVDRRMQAVRDAVGDEVDIGLDAHTNFFQPAKALAVAEVLAPYRPLFLEEPIRPENREVMGYLRGKTSVPIATGEQLYTKYEFRDLLRHQGADIIQPDICVVGGLWEMKKIAAMAEADYVVVAPHNPLGPVATAVNVHFSLSTHNFLILEYRADDDTQRKALVDKPMDLKEGYLLPPTRPGLGIDLNLETCERQTYKSWRRPALWRVDGSLGYH
jgi:galactonate dehydratase